MFLLFGAIISGVIGIAIGSMKGRSGTGGLLGLLLGPIGWIIIAILPSTKQEALTNAMLTSVRTPPVVTAKSVTDQLLDLKKLLDAGIIDAAEFEHRKAPLLAQLSRPVVAAPAESSVKYRIPGIN